MASKTADTQSLLEKISDKLGLNFTPLIFEKMAHDPTLLQHVWDLVEGVLIKGRLHRLTKEMIFVVTASVKHCRYCVTAHKAMAKDLGLSAELVGALDGDLRNVEPESTRDMLRFAHSLASNNEDDAHKILALLKEQGVQQQDLDEIILMVGVASMMSTLANGMSLNDKVDRGFLNILAG